MSNLDPDSKPYVPEYEDPNDKLDSKTQDGPEVDVSSTFEIKKPKTFILCNDFSYDPQNKRSGNEKDKQRILEWLKNKGYSEATVLEYTQAQGLSDQRIKETIKEWSSDEILGDADSLIFFVMSHGGKDIDEYFHGQNCKIYLKDVYEKFANNRCPALCGKPKLFFFQCCRGSKTDYGSRNKQKKNNIQTDSSKIICTANKAEYLFSYASFEDYVSYRLHDTGSLFINSLMDVFTDEKNNGCELHSMLIKVNHLVSEINTSEVKKNNEGEYSTTGNILNQVPIFNSSLTKEVYFK